MGTSLALRTRDPRTPRFALWLSSAGLEATYIYAWAAFVLTLNSDQRYSALLAVSAFAGASLLARALAPAELRIGELALLHSAGLMLVSLLSIHSLIYPTAAWWRVDIVFGSHSIKTWLTIALAVFFSWSLWLAGFRHGREPSSYERVCARFDRGILWLGALFVLKLLWRGQRDANLDDGVTGSLIVPYFLFAVVALAAARDRGMGAKSLIGGYGGFGRIANVSVVGVLVTLACVLLLLPELRVAARVSYEALRELGGPIASVFAFLLYVLLGLWMSIRGPHQAASALKKQIVFVNPKPSYHDQTIFPAHELPAWLAWAVVVALLAGSVVGACWVVWRVRRPAAESGRSFFAALWRWAKNLCLVLRRQLLHALTRAPRQPEHVRIYLALLQWGRRTGSPHRASETPLEYACRLQRRMPALSADFELIATTYCEHAYGARRIAARKWRHEQAALRRLHSLKHWPRRLKLWLTGDAEEMTATPSLREGLEPNC